MSILLRLAVNERVRCGSLDSRIGALCCPREMPIAADPNGVFDENVLGGTNTLIRSPVFGIWSPTRRPCRRPAGLCGVVRHRRRVAPNSSYNRAVMSMDEIMEEFVAELPALPEESAVGSIPRADV